MGKYALIFCTALVVLGLGLANAGQMYKWVDGSGNVSYHDRPPPGDSNVQVERKKYRSAHDADLEDEYAREEASRKSPVVLYVIPKCEFCDLARNYLKQHKIPFAEKDVASNAKNNRELVSKGGSKTVPTVSIGEKFIIGYEKAKIEQGLIEAGYMSAGADNNDTVDDNSDIVDDNNDTP